jgi:hypothetical protein
MATRKLSKSVTVSLVALAAVTGGALVGAGGASAAPAVDPATPPGVPVPYPNLALKLSAIKIPTFNIPTFDFPALKAPGHKIPGFQVPDLQFPALKAPTFAIAAQKVINKINALFGDIKGESTDTGEYRPRLEQGTGVSRLFARRVVGGTSTSRG